MGRPLLQQLLAVVRAILLKSTGTLTGPLTRVLRIVSLVWSILRSRLQIGSWGKRGGTDKGLLPPRQTNTDKTNSHDESKHHKEHNGSETQLTIPTSTDHHTIPLDSSVSCSLHPYPYIHHNQSRSSLNSALRAARSAHSLAVSSRNASRTSHDLSLRIGRPSSVAHSAPRAGGSAEDEYTFDVKSPDQPVSPVSRLPRRGFSMSSPDLRTDHSGVSQQILDLGKMPSRSTASPVGSLGSPVGDEEQPNLSHERIFPISPEWFQRYERSTFVPDKETQMIVKSLTLDFQTQQDPPGWKHIIHPEGVLYFFNSVKKAVTEANLYDPVYYEQITEDLQTFDDFICEQNIALPANYTLAMDLNADPDGSIITDYYFADHDKRVIFFLDEVQASDFGAWSEVKGVTSMAHLRHEFEAQYWNHCMMYPNTMPKLQETSHEMRDLILHYIGDATTSAFSTSPYDLDELYKMLSLANSLRKIPASQTHTTGAASLISRIMFVFTRQKFYNWFGLPQRRVYRNLSVHGTKPKRTFLIKILSPLLFNAPDIHLSSLEKMWVDGIMHGAVWSQSIKKLNDEWQEFILYATVLLNANVAYLAIQSIDIDKNPYRSPVQIACYLSIVSSIGSIIIGLLLVRQNRTRAHGTANDVCQFLKERSHPTLGLETLAILYSLPYALLLWGMVSFLAAFAWNCFDASSAATRTLMGSAWVIFGALVAWCVWMGWVHHKSEADELPAAGPEDSKEGVIGIGIDIRHPTIHEDPMRIFQPVALGRVGSRGSVGTQPAGASVQSGRSGRQVRVASPAAAGREKKKRWNWPTFVFWNLKRTSYDSPRTIV